MLSSAVEKGTREQNLILQNRHGLENHVGIDT